MTEHYLRTCYKLFPELTEHKYKRVQDLKEIENLTAHIRLACRLTYDDIEVLTENRFLDVRMFGYWPVREEIACELEQRVFDFAHLPESEEQVVQELLSVFRQIEIVSVILRFVDPKNYGILSPPVEQILGVGSTYDHREKYRLYVKNIRTIRDYVDGFSRAAEVDIALWVLSVGVLNGELSDESKYNRLEREHANDLLLRTIRVENLTGQLFGKLQRRELAEALNRCSSSSAQELAGQIAGIEFEKAVKELLGTSPEHRGGLWGLVQQACAHQPAARSWREAVRIRNKVIHTNGHWSAHDVERLIEAMQEAHQLSQRLVSGRRRTSVLE